MAGDGVFSSIFREYHTGSADSSIGGVTLLLLALTLPNIRTLPPFDGQPDYRPVWLKILRIDWLGAALTIGFVTCLGVGLQYGGISHKWSDVPVVLVGCANWWL